jgi:hypothetical protein
MTFMRLAAAALAAALFAGAAAAQSAADSHEAREICAADFQKACPDAKPGNGSLGACARAHFMRFSRPCKTELKAVRARMRQSGQTSGA